MKLPLSTRRSFISKSARGIAAAGLALDSLSAFGQDKGERPPRPDGVSVLSPRSRAPIGMIIDDSTCLVNLNKFAMPQFDTAFAGENQSYKKPWRDWPSEIPDSFVRKFGEWAASTGVKGKYSIVPYPACVGRLDRMLPGWTKKELDESINLVRTLMMPNWDIHPEMCTHTRVIDTRTGHPYPEFSLKFMENWDWTTGRSVAEIADYMAYALRILKNAGLACEGITTPGGFGNRARPQLAQATLESVRDVFGAEIPHYFRDAYSSGDESVAPRIEYASGLDGTDPRCVVSIVACTGDWTGGWDNTPPGGADKFITPDLKSGRVVDVIQRGEPAMMLGHWTGMFWNGQELGFKILQEVVRRVSQRFDNLIWMKLSEVSRYYAAKELTRIEESAGKITLHAPFQCPDFTIRFSSSGVPQMRVNQDVTTLKEVQGPLKLTTNTWCRDGQQTIACFALPKGKSEIEL